MSRLELKTPPTPWLDRARSRSPVGPCVPGGRQRAWTTASASVILTRPHEPSNVSRIESSLTTPESSDEGHHSTGFTENNRGSGTSRTSSPCGTSLSVTSSQSSDPPASSSSGPPIERDISCRPQSEALTNRRDQNCTLFFGSPVWARSTTSLLVVRSNGQTVRRSRSLSDPRQVANSRRLSLDEPTSREELVVYRSAPNNRNRHSSVARRRRRVSLSCDIPLVSPLPLQRPSGSTAADDTTSSQPPRLPITTSLAVSQVVDTELAKDLFESWTRGEALPVSIMHRDLARSASAGSQPTKYHYQKRSSSSLSHRPDFEALARVGGLRIRPSSLNVRGGRSTDRSGRMLRSLCASTANKPLDDYHDQDDEDLEIEADETSTAPSSCGPFTPSSFQFSPTTVTFSSCSHRASVVSATIEEEDLEGGRGTPGQIFVPDLRLRRGSSRSNSPHPANNAPATVLTPFVNDHDTTLFTHPRPAPKPPTTDGSAVLAPEVLATRALLLTPGGTPNSPLTRSTTAPGGMTTAGHSKVKLGIQSLMNLKLPTANEEAGRKRSLLWKLGIGHFGLKSIGARVKAEAGRVRSTL
ncbi:hypothetical protein PQX77_020734 [Marasmius sp. AFHP31]|nr:hypothetical protein PQX77_020734 [Marasmius sp. AFHP31]